MATESQKAAVRVVLGDVVGAKVHNGAGMIALPPDVILLEVYRDGYQACTIDAFLEHFGDALPAAVPVDSPAQTQAARKGLHAKLVAKDPDGHLGWKRHFDRWRQEGRLD